MQFKVYIFWLHHIAVHEYSDGLQASRAFEYYKSRDGVMATVLCGHEGFINSYQNY